MATLLILDGQQRKSLALTRFLGADGHRVLTAEVTRFAISRYSRFATRSFVYPPPGQDPDGFMAWLNRLVVAWAVDVVIPTDDDTTDVLTARRGEVPARAGLLIPPRPSFAAMQDKARTAQWLQRLGIPHPPTLVVQDLGQVGQSAAFGYPLVIKPRITSGSRGMRFVHQPADLKPIYAAVHRHYPWPVIQQFIPPGPKYHVCFLFDRSGKAVARYVQRELRQYPIRGGPSTMQESVDRPDLLRLVEPLFAALPWEGAVHADVMEDGRTGQPYVLEVNPRYWSSLQLALRAGLNFARLHVALALGQPVPAQTGYRTDVRGRALLPFDILAFLADPARRHLQPPFFSRYGRHTWDDLLAWSDPGPTLGFLLAVLRYLFDGGMWRAVLRYDVR